MQLRPCTCKATKCLKLYCQCFHAGVYCAEGLCKCSDCSNTPRSQDAVIEARLMISIRNPQAFAKTSAVGEPSNRRGCNCRRSRCLKKYCDCFGAGSHCSTDVCRCTDCLNYVGSVHAVSAMQGRLSEMPSVGLTTLETASNDSNVAEDQPAVTQQQQTQGQQPNVMLYGREAHQPPTTLDSLRWLGMPSHRANSVVPDTATSGAAAVVQVASASASQATKTARMQHTHEGPDLTMHALSETGVLQSVTVQDAALGGNTAYVPGSASSMQAGRTVHVHNSQQQIAMQSASEAALYMAKQGSAESQTITSQLQVHKVGHLTTTNTETPLQLPYEASVQLPVGASGLAPVSSLGNGQVRQLPGLTRRHSEPCLKQLQSISIMLQQTNAVSSLKLLPMPTAAQIPLLPVTGPLSTYDSGVNVVTGSTELTTKQSANMSLPDQLDHSVSRQAMLQPVMQPPGLGSQQDQQQQQQQQALQQQQQDEQHSTLMANQQELPPPAHVLPLVPTTLQAAGQGQFQNIENTNLAQNPKPANTIRVPRATPAKVVPTDHAQPSTSQQQHRQLTGASNKPTTPCHVPIPSNLDPAQLNKILSFMNSPDCFAMLSNIMNLTPGPELQSALSGMLSLLHACTNDVTHLTPQRAWGEDCTSDMQYAATVAANEQITPRHRTLALQLIPCIACSKPQQQPVDVLGHSAVIPAVTNALATDSFLPLQLAGLCVASLMAEPAFTVIRSVFETAVQRLSQLDWSPVVAYCQQVDTGKLTQPPSSIWQELASIPPSIALLGLPGTAINQSAYGLITSTGLGVHLGLVPSDAVIRPSQQTKPQSNQQQQRLGYSQEEDDDQNDVCDDPHNVQSGHAVCMVQLPSGTGKVAAVPSLDGNAPQQPCRTEAGTTNAVQEQETCPASVPASESGVLARQTPTMQASLDAIAPHLQAPSLHMPKNKGGASVEPFVKPSPRLIETAIQLPTAEPVTSPISEQGRACRDSSSGVAQSPSSKPHSPMYRRVSNQQLLPEVMQSPNKSGVVSRSDVQSLTQAPACSPGVSTQRQNRSANKINSPRAGIGLLKGDQQHTGIAVKGTPTEFVPQHGRTEIMGIRLPMNIHAPLASPIDVPAANLSKYVSSNPQSNLNTMPSPSHRLQPIQVNDIHVSALQQRLDHTPHHMLEKQQVPPQPQLLPGGYNDVLHSAIDLSSYFVFGSPIPAKQESALPVIDVPPPHQEVTKRIRAMQQQDHSTAWAPLPMNRVSAPGIPAQQLQQPTMGMLGRVGSIPTHSSSSTMSAFMSSAGGTAAQAALFAAGLPVIGGFGTIWHTGSGSYSGASVPVHETGPAGPFLPTYNSSTSSVLAYTMAMPAEHQQACHLPAAMPPTVKTSVHSSPGAVTATPVSRTAKFIGSPHAVPAMMSTPMDKISNVPVSQPAPISVTSNQGHTPTVAKESNVSGSFLPVQTQYPTITTGALPGNITPGQAAQLPCSSSGPVSIPTVMVGKVSQPGNQVTTSWQQQMAHVKPETTANNITMAGYTQPAPLPQAATLYMLGPDGQLWQLPSTTTIQPMPSVSVAPLTVWPSFQSSGFHVDSRDQSTGLAIQPLNTLIPQPMPTAAFNTSEQITVVAGLSFQQPGMSHPNQLTVANEGRQAVPNTGNTYMHMQYAGQKTARETGAEKELMHSPAKRQRLNPASPTRNASTLTPHEK